MRYDRPEAETFKSSVRYKSGGVYGNFDSWDSNPGPAGRHLKICSQNHSRQDGCTITAVFAVKKEIPIKTFEF
jgi:hypothetical protein